MSRALPPRSATHRIRGLALAASALGCLAMLCRGLAVLTRSAWQAVLAPGPASPDQALIVVAGSLALALSIWLLGALIVSLLAALGPSGSTLSRATTRGARLIAPTIVRNAVAALLGIAITAAPTVAGAAVAKGGPASHRAVGSATLTARSAAPAWYNELSAAWSPAHPEDAGTPFRSTTSAAPAGFDPSLLPGWSPSPPPRSPRRSAAIGDPGPPIPRAARLDPGDEIVVRRGDTLWDIAARHLGPGAGADEIAREWPHWFTANRAVLGDDPDRLSPGERLRPPDRAMVRRQAALAAPAALDDGVRR